MTDPDALIDDLVADIIDTAGKNMALAQDAFRKLTDDPRLIARYGDFNLGITFGSKVIRRDIHKALAAKGMSTRQIAATTGVNQATVSRDLNPRPKTVADASASPAVLATDASASPAEDEAPGFDDFVSSTDETTTGEGAVNPSPIAYADGEGPTPPKKEKPSKEAAAALALLNRLADLDTEAVIMSMSYTQHTRLRAAARRAKPKVERLSLMVISTSV